MFWKKKLTKVFAPVLQKPVLQEIVDELKHQDRFIQMFVNRCDQKLDQMKMIIDSAQVTSVKNSEMLGKMKIVFDLLIVNSNEVMKPIKKKPKKRKK